MTFSARTTSRLVLRTGLIILASMLTRGTQAFTIKHTNRIRPSPPLPSREQFWNYAVAGTLSTILLTANAGPASAAATTSSETITGTLAAAIVQVSNTGYPVLTSIEDVSPLTSKLADIVDKKMSPFKAAEALDQGIDTFLSIPDANIQTFAGVLKSSYAGVSGESCQTLRGTAAAANQFASLSVVQGLDATKVQALGDKFAAANQAVPHNQQSGDICWPASRTKLADILVGQTELTFRGIPEDSPEAKAFVYSLKRAVGSVKPADLVPLLPEAKKTFGNVDAKTSKQFQMAGSALERAFQDDVRVQKRLQ